jgi:hypothetical protein
MGLDIKVYQNIRLEDDPGIADFKAYVIDPAWKSRIKNLVDGGYYSGTCVYRGAGYSYSTHGEFRGYLLKLIRMNGLVKDDGNPDYSFPGFDNLIKGLPFEELINFADNEGCLDWECCEKLYQDFLSTAHKVVESAGFLEGIYHDWLQALDYARHNGVIEFC